MPADYLPIACAVHEVRRAEKRSAFRQKLDHILSAIER